MKVIREWVSEAYAQSLALEDGITLALMRILVALALLDQLLPFVLSEDGRDVLRFAFSDTAHGGYRNLLPTPWMKTLGGNDFELHHTMLSIALGANVLLLLGLFGRLPALVLAFMTGLVYAQNNEVSGGSDLLLGNVLFFMVLGDTTHTLSLDCRIRSGRFLDPSPISAWPRKMAMIQLVTVYTATGFQKLVSTSWLPFDNFSALYQILQSPQWMRFPRLISDYGAWVLVPAWLGSVTTIVWECTFPMVLIQRRSRLVYGVVGAGLHLGIWAVMEVGLFSHLSMAFYPSLFAPELSRWVKKWHGGAPVVDRCPIPDTTTTDPTETVPGLTAAALGADNTQESESAQGTTTLSLDGGETGGRDQNLAPVEAPGVALDSEDPAQDQTPELATDVHPPKE